MTRHSAKSNFCTRIKNDFGNPRKNFRERSVNIVSSWALARSPPWEPPSSRGVQRLAGRQLERQKIGFHTGRQHARLGDYLTRSPFWFRPPDLADPPQ